MVLLNGIQMRSAGIGKKIVDDVKFTKNKYSTTFKAWKNNIYLGSIETKFKKKDVDWVVLKADKTKRIGVKDRWDIFYYASISLGLSAMGPFNSKEDAGQAIINEHRRIYEEETGRFRDT